MKVRIRISKIQWAPFGVHRLEDGPGAFRGWVDLSDWGTMRVLSPICGSGLRLWGSARGFRHQGFVQVAAGIRVIRAPGPALAFHDFPRQNSPSI